MITFKANDKTFCLIAPEGMAHFLMRTEDGTLVKHSMAEDIAEKMLKISAEESAENSDYNICSVQGPNRYFFQAIEVRETEEDPAPKKGRRIRK